MNISVLDFVNDNSLLEVSYVPFDVKVQVAKAIIYSVAENAGYLDSSILRRVAFETIVTTITNIDIKADCGHGLKGYDYLCYTDSEDLLITMMGSHYYQFNQILQEQIEDYKDGTFKYDEVSEG